MICKHVFMYQHRIEVDNLINFVFKINKNISGASFPENNAAPFYILLSLRFYVLILAARKVAAHPGPNSIPEPSSKSHSPSLVSGSKNNHNSASHDIKIIN